MGPTRSLMGGTEAVWLARRGRRRQGRWRAIWKPLVRNGKGGVGLAMSTSKTGDLGCSFCCFFEATLFEFTPDGQVLTPGRYVSE